MTLYTETGYVTPSRIIKVAAAPICKVSMVCVNGVYLRPCDYTVDSFNGLVTLRAPVPVLEQRIRRATRYYRRYARRGGTL